MSASNTITPENQEPSKASARPNPVALEALVSVTGALANSGPARDLFTEDTKTVLVFSDGAVIRLTAIVTPGQLLFLTNKRSTSEVVCQVLHVRPFTDTVSYVDLQFTEAKPGFWDVKFSSATRTSAEFSIREHMEAERATHGDSADPVQPHTTEDVEQLKNEVEALRKKLLELELKNKPRPAVPAALVVPSEPPPPPPRVPLTPAAQHEIEAPLMPSATDTDRQAPTRAVVGMSLPIRVNSGTSAASDPSDPLLPKPGLDFSHVPDNTPPQPGLNLVRRRRALDYREWLVLILGAILLLGLVAGLWLGKPWRRLSLKKTPPVTTSVSPAEPLADTPKPPVALNPHSNGNLPALSNNYQAPLAPSSRSAGIATPIPEISASVGASNAFKAERKVSSGNSAGGKMHAKTAIVESPEKNSRPLDTTTNDAPVLPAKLLRAVSPVYPPDALLNFIAGDVRAEAVVGPDGRIGEVKILSGPQRFREAAVTALQQYQYTPATQGGKPVSSRVSVTVKFWFDP